MQQDDVWVFGYGSIIWANNEVHRTEEVSAFIRGYKRRFRWRSPDHRGTVDDPRLVTSIFNADEWENLGVEKDDAAGIKGLADDEWRVRGRAFCIAPSYRDKEESYLDKRKCHGYVSAWLLIYKYRSDGDTDDFIGEKDLTLIATSTMQDIRRAPTNVKANNSKRETFARLSGANFSNL